MGQGSSGKQDQGASRVALLKCDMLKGIVDPKSRIHRDSRHEGGFNFAECMRVSHEVMEHIREWDSPQLCHQAEKFESTCFFAFSSLGELPDYDMRIRSVNPHCVADPLLWVLWKLGYIRTLEEK